jgi:hypothetical protein
MATRVELNGGLTLSPPSGTGGASQTVPIRESATYSYDDKRPFAGAHAHTAVALGPMTSVKMLVAEADTPISLELTHADGTDQVVPVDGLLVLHCPNKPITGLKLNGTANGVLIFAGD